MRYFNFVKNLTMLLLLILLVFTGACSTSVKIDTEPEDVKTYINGQYIGETPVKKDLDNFVLTSYSLRLEKEGYETVYDKLGKEIKIVPIAAGVFTGTWISILWGYGPKPYHYYNMMPVDPEKMALEERADEEIRELNEFIDSEENGGKEKTETEQTLTKSEIDTDAESKQASSRKPEKSGSGAVAKQLPAVEEIPTGKWNETEKDPAKIKVAVLDFTSTSDNVDGQIFSELFSMELINKTSLTVVDRAQLSRVLEEQKLQMSGMTENQEIQIGQLLGADKIITGRISKMGNRYYLVIKGIDITSASVEISERVYSSNLDRLVDQIPELSDLFIEKALGE